MRLAVLRASLIFQKRFSDGSKQVTNVKNNIHIMHYATYSSIDASKANLTKIITNTKYVAPPLDGSIKYSKTRN